MRSGEFQVRFWIKLLVIEIDIYFLMVEESRNLRLASPRRFHEKVGPVKQEYPKFLFFPSL